MVLSERGDRGVDLRVFGVDLWTICRSDVQSVDGTAYEAAVKHIPELVSVERIAKIATLLCGDCFMGLRLKVTRVYSRYCWGGQKTLLHVQVL